MTARARIRAPEVLLAVYRDGKRVGLTGYSDGRRSVDTVSVYRAIETFAKKHKLRGEFGVLARGHGGTKLFAASFKGGKLTLAASFSGVRHKMRLRTRRATGKGRASGSVSAEVREVAAAIARSEGVAKQKCACCNDVAPPEACECCDGASSRAHRASLDESCPVPGRTNVAGSKWCSTSKRLGVYARDGRHEEDIFSCVYCEASSSLVETPKKISLDHHVPRSKGGGNEAANLLTACISCNSTRKDFGNRIFFSALREFGIDTTNLSPRIRSALARKVDMKLGALLYARRCALRGSKAPSRKR